MESYTPDTFFKDFRKLSYDEKYIDCFDMEISISFNSQEKWKITLFDNLDERYFEPILNHNLGEGLMDAYNTTKLWAEKQREELYKENL